LADESWAMAAEAERDVDAASALWACVVVAAYRGDVERVRAAAPEAARLASVRPATEEKLSTGVQEPGLLLGFPEHVEAAIATGELVEAAELIAWVEE